MPLLMEGRKYSRSFLNKFELKLLKSDNTSKKDIFTVSITLQAADEKHFTLYKTRNHFNGITDIQVSKLSRQRCVIDSITKGTKKYYTVELTAYSKQFRHFKLMQNFLLI